MTRLRGPYSVAFPVNFTSKGDTTRDAFRKHMDEITRIYGILTGLDADTMDADNVNNSVNEILQKWKPSMSFSDISGNLPASRVSGALTNATIDAGKVNGLPVTVGSLNGRGYEKFPNGLILQWDGSAPYDKDDTGNYATFPLEFREKCFCVSLTPVLDMSEEMRQAGSLVALTLIPNSLSKTMFHFHIHHTSKSSVDFSDVKARTRISYVAIGV